MFESNLVKNILFLMKISEITAFIFVFLVNLITYEITLLNWKDFKLKIKFTKC